MTLLEQCQIWNENDEYQKIIDTIEAIPEEKLTPELCSELARAYNNAADIGDREMFEKALALLLPYADHFQGGTHLELPGGLCLLLPEPGESGPALL